MDIMSKMPIELVKAINCDKIRGILPTRYRMSKASEHDFAILYQLHRKYQDVMIIRYENANTFNIEFVSLMSPNYARLLNPNTRKLLQRMLDFLMDESPTGSTFKISLKKDMKDDVRIIFESYDFSKVSQNEDTVTYNIQKM
jgi:hypothetical protein